MLRFHPRRFRWALALTLGLWAVVAQAREYRYHYISLTEVQIPSGFTRFNPTAIDDHGRVYGNTTGVSVDSHVAVYDHGVVKVLQPGIVFTINTLGTIGGAITDPQTGTLQPALFRGKKVEIIPLLPGETRLSLLALNDADTALIWSEDPSGFNRNTYRLYSEGKTIFRYQIPTGSDCFGCWGVNNRGVVVGTIFDPNLNAFRAIRFRPPYDEPQLLDPLPTDSDSTSFGINNAGYILGSSHVFLGDPAKNHYGVWDRKGNFKTFVTTGIFYEALFNDKNLIVLTENMDTDFNSYLVPRPGVRWNVEDLVNNPTAVEAPLAQVVGINNHGDMIGYGLCSASPCPRFLLRRLRH
jgi:hypothetical protein